MTVGDGYVVDTATLTATATAVRAVVEAQRGRRLDELLAGVAAYGDDALTAAVTDFCTRWGRGLDLLVRDAEAIARTLSDAVTTYEETERANGRRFPVGSAGRG